MVGNSYLTLTDFAPFLQLPPEDARTPGVAYLSANYDNIDATTKMLEDNDIDTIVSAISIESEATSTGQINLIAAADQSKTTTRFIPSEYGFIATPEYGPNLFDWMPIADN